MVQAVVELEFVKAEQDLTHLIRAGEGVSLGQWVS